MSQSFTVGSIVFGETVQKYQKLSGLSRQNLAFDMDVDSSYIFRIEDGSRTPSLEKLIKMADAFRLYGAERVHFFSLTNRIEKPLTPKQAEWIARILEDVK